MILMSQNYFPKHFDWVVAKLVLILANKNAQIREISFYQLILPQISLRFATKYNYRRSSNSIEILNPLHYELLYSTGVINSENATQVVL